MTEEMTRDYLKGISQPLISQLREEKWRSKEQGRYLWWFPLIPRMNMYFRKNPWGGIYIIGSLASHLGILVDEFEDLLTAGKLSKIMSWYNNPGLCVKTHRDHSITWIDFYKSFYTLQWSHLQRHQIIGETTRPAWVCRPSCGWVEISSGDNIRLDGIYRSSEDLFKRLAERCEAEDVLKTMEDYAKISRSGLQWGAVEHNTRKREFSLPNIFVPVTKSRL